MSVRFKGECEPFTLFCVSTIRFRGIQPTNLTLLLADRSVKVPKGIVEDVILKVDEFYFPMFFMVLDIELVLILAVTPL